MKRELRNKSTIVLRMSPWRNYITTMVIMTTLVFCMSVSHVYADDRTVTPATPRVDSVNPDSARGLRQEFRFNYSSTVSRDFLASVSFLFADSKDDTDALFVKVELAEQKVRLGTAGRFTSTFVDDGIIGEAKTLVSRHVNINLRTAARNNTGTLGIQVIMTLDFSDKDFRGRKNIYMSAQELQGPASEFILLGQYTIEGPTSNNAPENIDVTPNDGDGKRQSFRIRVKDNDGVTDIRQLIVVFAKDDRFRTGRSLYNTGDNLIMILDTLTEEIEFYNAGRYSRSSALSTDLSVSKYFNVNLQNTRVLRAPPEDGVRKVLQFHPDIQFKPQALGEWKIFSYVVDSRGRSDGFEELGKFKVPGGSVGVRGLHSIPGNSRGPYDDGIEDRVMQRFVCVWYDTDGRDDIRWMQFKLSPNADQQDDIFHFAINLEDPNRPTAFIFNDFGIPGASGRIGRNVVLSNAQGSMNLNSMQLTPLGTNQYRAEFEVSFDRSFRGAYKIYMRGEDFADNRSPWRRKGKYVVTSNNRRPNVNFIRPVIDSGLGTRFVFRWKDPDGPNDIKYGDVWFGPVPDVDGIRLTYDHARNRIEVSSNGATISAPPGAPIGELLASGLKAQLDNVYVFKEGEELVLSIEVLFDPDRMDNPGFNLIHLRSRDFRGKESRWFARGSYTATADGSP